MTDTVYTDANPDPTGAKRLRARVAAWKDMDARPTFSQKMDKAAKVTAQRAKMDAENAPPVAPKPAKRVSYFYRPGPDDPPVIGITKAFVSADSGDLLAPPQIVSWDHPDCVRVVNAGEELSDIEIMAWKTNPQKSLMQTIQIVRNP